MNTKKVIDYWKQTAEEDWRIANSLFKLKHYPACLFYCHLTLEKLLKSLVVRHTQNHAPYIHDLTILAAKTKLHFTDKQITDLQTISTFNIAGRYDNVKLAFHRLATLTYTKKYLTRSKELYVWLEKKFQQK